MDPILLTGSLVGMALLTKRHYRNTYALLHRLDELVAVAESLLPHRSQNDETGAGTNREVRSQGETAVLLS